MPKACSSGQNSVIARVFEQKDGLEISCIEFAYRSLGQDELTLSLYVDSTGGNPDVDSLTLVDSITVSSKNSNLYPQLQTVSFGTPVLIPFPNKHATLVVTLSFTPNTGLFVLGAQRNHQLTKENEETFLSGDCIDVFDHDGTEFVAYSDLDYSGQWYVKLTGTSDESDSNDDVCFSGNSLVALADGSHMMLQDLKIGDQVLAATDSGESVSADVVFLPHLYVYLLRVFLHRRF